MNRSGHRYLLVKLLTKDPPSAQTVADTINSSVEQMFGKFGSAEMKVRLIGLDPAGEKAVVRCALGSVQRLRGALATIVRVNGQPAGAMVVRSAGTIKGLDIRMQRRQR